MEYSLINKLIEKYKFDNASLSFLDGKSVLILGASGFLGGTIYSYLKFLNKIGINVNAVGSQNNGVSPKFIKVNILQVDDFTKVSTTDWDFVINCGCPSDSNFANEHSLELLKLSSEGMFNILNNISYDKFLHLSSGAVYGEQTDIFQLSESAKIYCSIDKRNIYRAGKIISEQVLQSLSDRWVNIRVFSVTGPGCNLNQNFAANKFLKAYADKTVIKLVNHEIIRSYLHSLEFAYITLRSLQFQNRETYNVGSEVPISISKFASMFGIDTEIIQGDIIGNSGSLYVPNCSKLRNKIKNLPSISVSDIINDMKFYYDSSRI